MAAKMNARRHDELLQEEVGAGKSPAFTSLVRWMILILKAFGLHPTSTPDLCPPADDGRRSCSAPPNCPGFLNFISLPGFLEGLRITRTRIIRTRITRTRKTRTRMIRTQIIRTRMIRTRTDDSHPDGRFVPEDSHPIMIRTAAAADEGTRRRRTKGGERQNMEWSHGAF